MQSTWLPPATDEEKYRFMVIKTEIGCICCGRIPADAHHILDTGKRISHKHTIPLCKHHHRMVSEEKSRFENAYGTELDLLTKTDLRYARFKHNTIGGKFYEPQT